MGMLAAVEIVQDRDTKERFPEEAQLSVKLTRIMERNGLLGRFGDIISIAPPLTITKDEVDFVVRAVDSSLEEVQTEL